MHILIQQFWKMVCERKQDQLQPWMTQAKNAGITELKNFVQGLEKRHQSSDVSAEV
jgi:hypothetical protein